ncbi:MAG: FKBP-type peptidyl-prolyl cis-trans isomerase [Bacteroidales bacterium]|nr:FKBP-type peptidyl-prolyl cis-trans isomerase [Bacteroidales bacterium]
MKRILLAALCIAMLASCQKGKVVVDTEKTPAFTNKNDSLSWALGFSAAQNIASTGVDINREILLQAICATLDSLQQPFTMQQTASMLMELDQRAAMNREQSQKNELNEYTIQEESYFTELMKSNSNVKKSDKGFYYEVLKEGNGRKGETGLVAVFDYKGMFTNGQIFDQTYGNRDAITYVISNDMFPGLFEAFQTMKGGGKYRFYFPYEMAFGARGTQDVPPYSTVIYEIELHEVRDL